MNILVTGGTGFIGFNLVKKLVRLNHTVSITGSMFENPIVEKTFFLNDTKNLKKQDVCFHLAANNDTLCDVQKDMFKTNLLEPICMFNRLLDAGCKKFIYASSTAVYGNNQGPYVETTKTSPLNLYAESKLAFDEFAEYFAKKNNISVIGLRYCNVYGPGEHIKLKRSSMILQIYNQMIKNQNPKIFKFGNQRRDWCYIKDVVDANIQCLKYKKSAIFNIGSGESVTFLELINIMNKNLKTKLKPKFIDCNFSKKYQANTKCDISKSNKELKWKPKYNIESGIGEYVKYLKNYSNFTTPTPEAPYPFPL